ncbi:MAG: hypothetical protein Q7V48_07540 [Deltaproteobacteria bacterium]|nr:hypothetical protein [Deltaproteobacteria bacterium]
MNNQNEEYILRKLQSIIVDGVSKIRETGKKIISSLVQHVTQKHPQYLTIKDQKDLQVTLEFFGIPVLVKAEILLDPSFQDPTVALPGGNISAYLLPEKEDDERTKLFSFNFDELGNVKTTLQAYTLHAYTFPIYFVKTLIDELLKKRISIS